MAISEGSEERDSEVPVDNGIVLLIVDGLDYNANSSEYIQLCTLFIVYVASIVNPCAQ